MIIVKVNGEVSRMQYLFACDCGYSRVLICRLKDYPANVVCDKCASFMYRDFKGEGASFQLRGGSWASNGYTGTDRGMIVESDKEVLATEKARIKRDKANGTYQDNC